MAARTTLGMDVSTIEILTTREEVREYVPRVCQASDGNRHALGFFPEVVFWRYAEAGKLFVAVRRPHGEYLGHLLFECRYPRATVLQAYCEPASRNMGVARALVHTLKESLAAHGFLSIRASVAEDLTESNHFWERMGFYVARRRPGGATTGRMILDRVFELDSPQLFPKSRLARAPLRLVSPYAEVATARPVYFVDLNIVFDVAHKRLHAGDAQRLLRASLAGDCSILISQEMHEELVRTARERGSDPLLRMLEALPRVPVPKPQRLKELAPRLAQCVFPNKPFPLGLSANDHSDLRHLATAIDYGATAFITRDGKILGAAARLESEHGLSVYAPESLWVSALPSIVAEARDGHFLSFQSLGEYLGDLQQLLVRCGIPAADATRTWLAGAELQPTSAALVCDGQPIAYALVLPSDPRATVLRVKAAVDEHCEHAGAAARLVLGRCCDVARQGGKPRIHLELPPRQSLVQEIAYHMGFRQEPERMHMTKVALARAVHCDNWSEIRGAISECAGLVLPAEVPAWHEDSQLLQVHCSDGECRFISIAELETLISPALFCLDGRPATLAPIRPEYSEALLGAFRQLSLAPQTEAATYREREYLCAPRLRSQFSRGGLVFFYQSQVRGEQAVIAVARILDVYLKRQNELSADSLRRSVLREDMLGCIGSSKDKAACLFDNLIFFERPVSLRFLRDSCGIASSRLMSVTRLSPAQAKKILTEGF